MYAMLTEGLKVSAPVSTRRIQMQHRLEIYHLMELAILWHDRYTVSNACCRDNTPVLHAYVQSSGCNVWVEIRHLRSFSKPCAADREFSSSVLASLRINVKSRDGLTSGSGCL